MATWSASRSCSACCWLVKDLPWVEMVPLAITLLVTHLGLLLWETRYVSLSLAYPGLKPGTHTEGPK